jgi:hypothetical protein
LRSWAVLGDRARQFPPKHGDSVENCDDATQRDASSVKKRTSRRGGIAAGGAPALATTVAPPTSLSVESNRKVSGHDQYSLAGRSLRAIALSSELPYGPPAAGEEADTRQVWLAGVPSDRAVRP